MNMLELGQRIRGLREKKGLKQSDIANALQISAQAVSKWERGENAPDIALLIDLSRLLGVTVDWILGGNEAKTDTFEATVFCSSLNGFAKRATTMAPRDVAAWANSIFHGVTEAVLRHEGVPIKYVGDGFLAFFTGNNHAQRALEAAKHSRQVVNDNNFIIALHSGEVYLGSIGHHDYASPDIIGNTVNSAFMINAWAAANLTSGLAITGSTAEHLGHTGDPHKVSVKGIDKPLAVFAIQ